MAQKPEQQADAPEQPIDIARLVEQELAKRAMRHQSGETAKTCLDCGTDLIRDRFEFVCPSDGHRFQVKDGELVVASRHMSGPGPDGVPDRRHYPSLEGGITRRQVEPKDSRPRGHDPLDEQAKAAAREAQRNARNAA